MKCGPRIAPFTKTVATSRPNIAILSATGMWQGAKRGMCRRIERRQDVLVARGDYRGAHRWSRERYHEMNEAKIARRQVYHDRNVIEIKRRELEHDRRVLENARRERD
ncbi:hypothetical protein LP419_23030 [Massilia sp. H-1]|nr:hypothetical protein LP419_23030 [Massilia sp. H-1]